MTSLPQTNVGKGHRKTGRRASIEQRLAFGLAAILVVLAIIGGASYFSLQRQRADTALVDHTYEVLMSIEGSVALAAEAEGAERGYLLTGERFYLSNFERAVGHGNDRIRHLSELTADHSGQQEKVKKLKVTLDDRIDKGRGAIALRRLGPLAEEQYAQIIVDEDTLMDQARVLAAELIAEEQALLNSRQQRVIQGAEITQIIIICGGIFAFVAAGLGLFLNRRDIAGRRSAELALRESDERFRQMASAIEHVFWMHAAAESQVLYVSPSFERIWGIPADELYRNPRAWSDSIHPLDRHRIEETFREWLRDPVHFKFDAEYRIVRPDGSVRWIADRGSPILDAWGHAYRLTGVAQDITERKLASEALQESQRHLREMVESLPQLVWNCLPDGYCDYLSPQWLQYTGLPAAPQLGFGWLEQMHPEDRERVRAAWLTAVQSEASYSIDLRIRRYDGVYRWFKSRGTPFRDRIGRITRWIGTCTDLDELKSTEQALRRREAELRRASLLAGLGYYYVPKSQEIVVSEGLAHVLGVPSSGTFTAAELIGFTHPEDRESVQNWSANILKGGPLENTHRIVRPNGEVRHVRVQAEGEFDDNEQFVGTFGVVQDITDFRESQEAAEEWRNRCEAVINASGQMLYDWNPATEKVTFGGNYQQMLGYTHEEMEGGLAAWLQLVHPDDREEFLRRNDQSMANRAPFHMEYRVRRKDGAYLYTDDHGYLFLNSNGSIARLIGSIVDITERKRAEEALRTSEEKFSNAFEHAAIGVALVSPEGRWLKVNRALCGIFGREEDQLMKMTFQDLTHPDDLSRDLALLHQMLSGELQTYQMEKRYFHADGSLIHAVLSVSLVRDSAGKPVNFISQIQDVTGRKKAEQAQEESEARLRLAMDAAGMGTWDLDLSKDGDVWCSGDFMVARENQPPGMAHFHGWMALLPPEERSRVIEAVDKSRREGTLYSTEHRYRVEGSSDYRWLLPAGRFLYDGQARPIRFVGVYFDVTERHRAEEAVRESEARFRHLADAMPQIVWSATGDGVVDYYNHRWYEYTGFPTGPATGDESWMPVIHPEDLDRCVASWHQTVQKGESHRIEIRLRNYLTGEYRWHLIRAVPITDRDGKVIRWFGTNTDIHELKAVQNELQVAHETMEQRVEERTAQLAEANRELEAFSYSVSHDLRTPLRTVDGYSQAVMEDYGRLLPDEGRRYLQTIRLGAQRMGDLIDDLLAFARLGRQPVNRRPVDMAGLVQTVLNDLEPMKEGRTIEFKISELPLAAGDPGLLRQVWTNLISNSIKYTRRQDNAVIEIGHTSTSEGAAFYVRDNGTGFDMRYVGKLFGVFQRLHRTEEYEGTGVGLAITQRIVQRHGGRIWAEGVLNKGATFSFTLEGNS